MYDLVVTATCSKAMVEICVESGPVHSQTCRGHGLCSTVNGLATCACRTDPSTLQHWTGSDCNTPANTIFEAPRIAAGRVTFPTLTAVEVAGADPPKAPAAAQPAGDEYRKLVLGGTITLVGIATVERTGVRHDDVTKEKHNDPCTMTSAMTSEGGPTSTLANGGRMAAEGRAQ